MHRNSKLELSPDKRFHPIPDSGIGLNLDVRFHKHSRIPGIALSAVLLRLVIGLKISKNLRLQRVSRDDLAPSVKEPIQLEEINSLRDVRRN